MMRSLYSGISGLKNHQTRMDVVGNNISNVNTTGFKSGRVTFSDTLSQTLSGASSPQDNVGGTNPKQIGLGSSVSAVDLLFTDGSVQSTGVNTDLCLSGNGLFIVNNGNNSYYTRNGNFKFDADGNYVNSDGLFVQGWMATKLGEAINTNGQPGTINIPAGKSIAPSATTTATFSNNLNAAEPTIKSIVATKKDGSTTTSSTAGNKVEVGSGTGTDQITAVTLTLSDGTKVTQTSGTYTVGYSIPKTTVATVYDSLGNDIAVTVYMTKTKASADGSEWIMSLDSDTGEDTQTLTDANGKTITVTMTPATVKFDTNGGYDEGSGTSVLTLVNGATDQQSVNMDFTALTQYAGSSTAYATTDGYAAGTLKSVSIDSSGVITGTYTNGLVVEEAQVAIAQFNNSSGLTKEGNSLYSKSNNSGEPNIGTINDLGCTVTPSALEMSNVDLATELTDMIVTQRGYQSNSKIITVSDEMLETIINMKR